MFDTIPRTFARLALVVGLVGAVLGGASLWAQAPAGAVPATSAEAAKVKKLLEEKFEGAVIGSVSKSPYFGLYEVMFDDQIVYTDAKANHVIVGSIYDANTKKNLTEARKRQLARVPFDSLPLDWRSRVGATDNARSRFFRTPIARSVRDSKRSCTA
jgi:thiol:disulfide interchange protein DsbC